jgi:hypothetical protein
MATSDILPLGESGPVSDIPNPILMGSAALTGVTAKKNAATATDHATRRNVVNCDFIILSLNLAVWIFYTKTGQRSLTEIKIEFGNELITSKRITA